MITLPVYKLYGVQTIKPTTQVKLGRPLISDAISYHIYHGTHSLKLEDWQSFFAHSNRLAKKHGER